MTRRTLVPKRDPFSARVSYDQAADVTPDGGVGAPLLIDAQRLDSANGAGGGAQSGRKGNRRPDALRSALPAADGEIALTIAIMRSQGKRLSAMSTTRRSSRWGGRSIRPPRSPTWRSLGRGGRIRRNLYFKLIRAVGTDEHW